MTKVVEYTTSKGTDMKIEIGEGKLIRSLTVNDKEIFNNNRNSICCFIGKDYVVVNEPSYYRKLGSTKPVNIELSDELIAIREEAFKLEKAKIDKMLENSRDIKVISSFDDFMNNPNSDTEL